MYQKSKFFWKLLRNIFLGWTQHGSKQIDCQMWTESGYTLHETMDLMSSRETVVHYGCVVAIVINCMGTIYIPYEMDLDSSDELTEITQKCASKFIRNDCFVEGEIRLGTSQDSSNLKLQNWWPKKFRLGSDLEQIWPETEPDLTWTGKFTVNSGWHVFQFRLQVDLAYFEQTVFVALPSVRIEIPFSPYVMQISIFGLCTHHTEYVFESVNA